MAGRYEPEAEMFDVWIDGKRTAETIAAASLADAVRAVVERHGEARGFSPLGRRDVTPAGGDWKIRALCSCEVEDDGDGESGPSLSIVEPRESCDLHGREADPEGWAEMERDERAYLDAAAERAGGLDDSANRPTVAEILDRQRPTFDAVLRAALELSPEDQRELVARLFDSRAGL